MATGAVNLDAKEMGEGADSAATPMSLRTHALKQRPGLVKYEEKERWQAPFVAQLGDHRAELASSSSSMVVALKQQVPVARQPGAVVSISIVR